jgi:soluble lytic murein transglycosylase-like protein
MAVIPDAPSLGRRAIPQSGRGMVSVDLSAGPESMIRAGQQISQVGEVLNKQVEQEKKDQDDLELAYANVEFLSRDAKTLVDSTADDNYQGYMPRYAEASDQNIAEAAKLITDNTTRQKFMMAAKLKQASNYDNIMTKASARRSDVTLANINTNEDRLAEAYVFAPDDNSRQEIIKNYDIYVDKNKSFLGDNREQEAEKRKASFREKTSLATWNARSDEDRAAIANRAIASSAKGEIVEPQKIEGADRVSPYSADKIIEIQSLLEKPSEFDPLFEEMGQKYGIDPKELKLRAIAESSFNPSAKGEVTKLGQARGLMQLETGTAIGLGVTDRNNPRQSVEGAAKLIAQHSRSANGNQEKIDELYHAGLEKNIGPNTKQYAANLAAVRASINGESFAKTGTEFDSLPLKEKAKIIGEARLDMRGKVSDIVNDEAITPEEKTLQISRLELKGAINTDFAAQGRRIVAAQSKIDSQSNKNLFSDFITRAYDLSALPKSNAKDYLIGVSNLKNDLLKAQEDGSINAKDAAKLNGQINQLTNAKIADSTQQVGRKFSDKVKLFKQKLPPDYIGEATRNFFYATIDIDKNDEAELNLKANEVIQNLLSGRREQAVTLVKKARQSDADFLASIGLTVNGINIRAKQLNVTPQALIAKLRSKEMNK